MFSFALTLDPKTRTPMYEQLYRALAEAIRGGALRSGEKLPSKRALCALLGVSRATVETAYDLLRAEGYVDARPRSGYYVEDYLTTPTAGPSIACPCTGQAAVPCPHGLHANSSTEDKAEKRPPSLFSTSAVDVSLFPYASWAKLYKEVVYNSPELLQRGDPRGEAPLREALARMLSEYRGVRCAPEQLVVGSGMETLMGQLITLFGPEAVYAMEDPGYPAMERTLLARDRTIRRVPMDASGMDPETLEASGASVAYLTPSHQFPLGITMPASRRSRLLGWAVAGERWIIEDDYDSEFRYGGRPISSMQGMDRHGRVIYAGTFSRSLAPAIRLAYMVLPPALLERWQALYGRQQPTVSRYEQTVMARFLDEGFYARYLRRVGKRYGDRRAALLEALADIDGLTVSGADGGIHFLVTLPRLSEAQLLELAAAAGLPLRGLSEFCRRVPPPASTLVLGYGGLPTEQVAEAVARLKAAWDPPTQ
ncbi:MAG: PLP-dependent aminotransferase family protein [Oscillospiraceae bacterium]|nr:PLP-dependent aminotransferase family protein [Oscillospiraceae bacterium]